MSQPGKLGLTADQRAALKELRQRLLAEFEVDSIIIFGSVARGEATAESDIDLLVLTTRRYERPELHQITDAVFEVNLQNDTNFSCVVIDRDEWESGLTSVSPLHHEVVRDGIAL